MLDVYRNVEKFSSDDAAEEVVVEIKMAVDKEILVVMYHGDGAAHA